MAKRVLIVIVAWLLCVCFSSWGYLPSDYVSTKTAFGNELLLTRTVTITNNSGSRVRVRIFKDDSCDFDFKLKSGELRQICLETGKYRVKLNKVLSSVSEDEFRVIINTELFIVLGENDSLVIINETINNCIKDVGLKIIPKIGKK